MVDVKLDFLVSRYKVILFLLVSSLLMLVVVISGISEDSAEDFPVNDSEDEIDFILSSNTSDIESVDVETSYLSVDDMYTLESPEINLESETCLRFYNYSGSVNLKEKSLQGDAEGFATCTLNASIDLTVDQNVDDMREVSTRELARSRNFDYTADDLHINPLDSSEELNYTDAELDVDDFEGKMQLMPPEGIYLSGKGVVRVNGEKLNY